MLRQGSYTENQNKAMCLVRVGNSTAPLVNLSHRKSVLTNSRKCPNVGKDTEEAVCSLTHIVYASASVSYPLVSRHKPSTG